MAVSAMPGSESLPDAKTPPAVHVAGVTYAYSDRVALDGLSLAVERGAIFGLLGPNGSGKSTLLSLLIGSRTAQSGEISMLGEPLSAGLRHRIGMVFQEPSLDPQMTVRETMTLQARMFALPRDEAESESAALLERVGLSDRARSFTRTLSGGMKRRLELARALLTRPDVMLLDEPTLALDPDSKQALWQHLTDVNAAGCTLLLATNDVAEAERYCGRIALLDGGRVVAEGAPGDLKRKLRHDAVRVTWRHGADAPAGLENWPGVGGVRPAGRLSHVTVDEAAPFLARLFSDHGGTVQSVDVEESTLEDVYFQIVGRDFTSSHTHQEQG